MIPKKYQYLIGGGSLIAVLSYLRYINIDTKARAPPDLPVPLVKAIKNVQELTKNKKYSQAIEARNAAFELREKYQKLQDSEFYIVRSNIASAILLGDLAMELNKIDDAEGFYYEAFYKLRNIEEAGSNAMIELTLKFANVLSIKKMYQQALDAYAACIQWIDEKKHYEKTNQLTHEYDINLAAKVHHDYGILLGNLARHDLSIGHLKKSIDYYNLIEHNFDDAVVDVYNSMSVIYADSKDFINAEICIIKAIEILQKIILVKNSKFLTRVTCLFSSEQETLFDKRVNTLKVLLFNLGKMQKN